MFVHGSQDDIFTVSQVEELYKTISSDYEQVNQSQLLCLKTFQYLGHDLDLEASNNSANLKQDIAEVQQVVSTWFSQHLH